MKVDHGKEFEKDLNSDFKDLYLRFPISWDRELDSFDAGNIIGARECDFKLAIRSDTPGRPWVIHIECKASIKHRSFNAPSAKSDLLKAPQLAKLRLAKRCGKIPLIFFKSIPADTIEIWTLTGIDWDRKTRPSAKPAQLYSSAEELIHTFLRKGHVDSPLLD